jgi:hypothetical protein
VLAIVALKRCLAERVDEADIGWLDERRPLAAQGIGSLDLIAALARLQRDLGFGLPEDFAIDRETSLAAVAGALRTVGPANRR